MVIYLGTQNVSLLYCYKSDCTQLDVNTRASIPSKLIKASQTNNQNNTTKLDEFHEQLYIMNNIMNK